MDDKLANMRIDLQKNLTFGVEDCPLRDPATTHI